MLELLEQQAPLFLDRDQGSKKLPGLLRMAGLQVECHSTHFQPEETDDVWIRECAKRGWVIITSDKGVENDPVNRVAVIESKARIFILDEKNSRPIFWAAALIVSKMRIYQVVQRTPGPFFANVARDTAQLVRDVRQADAEPSKATESAAAAKVPDHSFSHIKF